ncbi:hypothetical protein CAAN1_22S00518 [[Candida] anglica]|uniref:SWI5-dependent HO expression protein 3 n=1 Tax=[Candida] anglica TaxID=148631 RepID=A0ABP0EL85_9ASCO
MEYQQKSIANESVQKSNNPFLDSFPSSVSLSQMQQSILSNKYKVPSVANLKHDKFYSTNSSISGTLASAQSQSNVTGRTDATSCEDPATASGRWTEKIKNLETTCFQLKINLVRSRLECATKKRQNELLQSKSSEYKNQVNELLNRVRDLECEVNSLQSEKVLYEREFKYFSEECQYNRSLMETSHNEVSVHKVRIEELKNYIKGKSDFKTPAESHNSMANDSIQELPSSINIAILDAIDYNMGLQKESVGEKLTTSNQNIRKRKISKSSRMSNEENYSLPIPYVKNKYRKLI